MPDKLDTNLELISVRPNSASVDEPIRISARLRNTSSTSRELHVSAAATKPFVSLDELPYLVVYLPPESERVVTATIMFRSRGTAKVGIAAVGETAFGDPAYEVVIVTSGLERLSVRAGLATLGIAVMGSLFCVAALPERWASHLGSRRRWHFASVGALTLALGLLALSAAFATGPNAVGTGRVLTLAAGSALAPVAAAAASASRYPRDRALVLILLVVLGCSAWYVISTRSAVEHPLGHEVALVVLFLALAAISLSAWLKSLPRRVVLSSTGGFAWVWGLGWWFHLAILKWLYGSAFVI